MAYSRSIAVSAASGCAVVAIVLASLAASSVAKAGDCATCPCGPGCVDLWYINTRCAPCCGNFREALDQIAIWHCEAGDWVRYSREQFLAATDSTLPICFYVHGIFSGEHTAQKQARELFQKVGAGMPPFRGVLWTWPSDFECGMSIRDQVYRGIATSQSQAFYLASIIDQLGPRVAVSLVGHSLGCRAVTATLHGLAAREIAGQPLSEPRYPAPRPIQAALIAPAIDPYSLRPTGQYGLALRQVDRILITYNPRDRVLHAFESRFDRRALGLRGLPRPAAGAENFQKVIQINANPSVGKHHVPSAYFKSPMVATWLRGFVGFLEEPEFVGAPP